MEILTKDLSKWPTGEECSKAATPTVFNITKNTFLLGKLFGLLEVTAFHVT